MRYQSYYILRLPRLINRNWHEWVFKNNSMYGEILHNNFRAIDTTAFKLVKKLPKVIKQG